MYFIATNLKNDAVLGELLLDETHLFHPLYDKVASRVERAFLQMLVVPGYATDADLDANLCCLQFRFVFAT
jgi:hypothetical protein